MKVFCRFAPPDEQSLHRAIHVTADEGDDGSSCTLTLVDNSTMSHMTVGCSGAFLPYPPAALQQDIFSKVAMPLLDDVMRGRHCALLAYGQTSTGKTHTMFGPDGGSVKYFHALDSRGIVPRVAEELFSLSRRAAFVEVSYYEIYNETITDVVAKLCAMPEARGTFAAGSSAGAGQVIYKATEKGKLRRSLRRVVCRNGAQCLQALGELSAIRHVSSTEHNLKSSRSHVVIEFHVHPPEGGETLVSSQSCTASAAYRGGVGLLTLVDLAGSECLKHNPLATPSTAPAPLRGYSAGAGFNNLSTVSSMPSTFTQYNETGESLAQQHAKRTVEMRNINTSLFALKKVVHALHCKAEHIPFKDSVLTVVLENCLQNPSAASLVVCLSSRQTDLAETLASLRFASEASKITPSAAAVRRSQAQASMSYYSRSSSSSAFVPESSSVPDDDRSASASSSTEDNEAASPPRPEEHHRILQARPQHEASLPQIPLPRMSDMATISSVQELLAGGCSKSSCVTRTTKLESSSEEETEALRAEVNRLTQLLADASHEMETSKSHAMRLMSQCNRLAQSYDSIVAELETSRLVASQQEKELAALRIEVHLLRNDQAIQQQQGSSVAVREKRPSALLDTTNAQKPAVRVSFGSATPVKPEMPPPQLVQETVSSPGALRTATSYF